MNPQKATLDNLGITDKEKDMLLALLSKASLPLREAPEWLVIAQKLGWEPPEETLAAMYWLVGRAYAGGWRPNARD